jgi:TonB family protein
MTTSSASEPARPSPGRLPLSRRKRAERAAARRRVVRRTHEAMTAAQKARDPTFHGRSPWSARLGVAALIVLVSGAVHGSVIGVGVWVSGMGSDDERTRERIEIEMRERVEEKQREQKKERDPGDQKKEDKKPEVAATRPREVPEDKPRPSEPEPPPDDQRPPPRVVGISLEATVDSGGGASFAVGNTRAGATSDRAYDPARVAKQPTTETRERAPAERDAPAATSNRKASRIPTTGVKMVLPKRKQPSKPDYPETLKAQGIEADVPVLVDIDVEGRVTAVKILRSSGYPQFDEAARQAALSEVFEPARKDGVAVPYQISFTYRFRLEDA